MQKLGCVMWLSPAVSDSVLAHWTVAFRAVRELGFMPECNGVYISRWHHGSPAHRYGLYALHWITGAT